MALVTPAGHARFGVMAIWSWLWILAGQEIIRFGSGILGIRKDICGLGRTKEYSISEMRDPRASPPVYQESQKLDPGWDSCF